MFWPLTLLLIVLGAYVGPSEGRTSDGRSYDGRTYDMQAPRSSSRNQSWYVAECMAKITEAVEPCSERAISNWNLNTLFVPSRLSTCCANWEVYDCFIQASLENCSLLEFQFLVVNMTQDALALQRSNCSRFKYHSETCAMYSGTVGTAQWTVKPVLLALTLAVFTFVAVWD